jgi:hypothetical protein
MKRRHGSSGGRCGIVAPGLPQAAERGDQRQWAASRKACVTAAGSLGVHSSVPVALSIRSAGPIRVIAQNNGWPRPSICHPIASPVDHHACLSSAFGRLSLGALARSSSTMRGAQGVAIDHELAMRRLDAQRAVDQ